MVLIIAEAGVNHNGSLEIAKELVDAAASGGADIIKFQSFIAKNLVIPEAKKASYQENKNKFSESQFEMLSRLELSFDELKHLKNYCDSKNIELLSSAFDFRVFGRLRILI